jgi:hypothetical protein
MKSQLPEGHENVVAVVINVVSHMACQTGDIGLLSRGSFLFIHASLSHAFFTAGCHNNADGEIYTRIARFCT